MDQNKITLESREGEKAELSLDGLISKLKEEVLNKA
jgi:hypothetical protein